MSLSWVGAGALTAGSGQTVAPPFPASGVVAGDIAVLVVVNKVETTTPNLPANFSAPSNNSGTGGAGAAGADSGPLRATMFIKVCDGSENGTSITVSFSVAHNGTQAQILILRATSGQYDVAGCGAGSVATAVTNWSQAVATDPGITAGDWVVSLRGATTDAGNWTAQNISVPGCTNGTTTQRGSTGTTNGNDLESNIATTDIASGTSTGALTVTGTETVSTTGVVFALRIRESTGGAVSLDAKGSAAAQAASSLAATRPLTAKGSAAANAPASLGALRPIDGKGSAGASARASLGASRPSAATGSSAASASGALTVTASGGGPKALDGAGKAAASGQGILALGRPFAGSGAVSGAGKGTSSVLRSLGGAGSGASSARGGLSGARSKTGKASAAASASASLTVAASGIKPLAGIGQAAADARGVLGKTRLIASLAGAAANAGASLTVTPASTLIVRRVETQRSNERWYWRKIPWDAR